jgi:hypothetical protein
MKKEGIFAGQDMKEGAPISFVTAICSSGASIEINTVDPNQD